MSSPQNDESPAILKSEFFESQMASLDEEVRRKIWSSLSRAREGKPTPGVEQPWGGEWLRWPCGDYKVILRRLNPEEVAAQIGTPRDGLYLLALEPSPI
jgi:hypothetical protein